MDEDYSMVYGIDKLAELLIERGIEFYVKDEVSLVYKDDVGNWHECWMAGADENRVNALIVVTPEQLLSVPDLNGIISENERLRKILQERVNDTLDTCGDCWGGPCEDCDCWLTECMDELRELGIEASNE